MKLFLYFITILLPTSLMAHPVSYEGGYSIMTESSNLKSETSVIYSPKWNLGIGVVYQQVHDFSKQSSLQFSWLVKRWNLPEAQANIYVYGGPGYADFDSSIAFKSQSFYRYGIQADYETRRIYTLIRFNDNHLFNDNSTIFNQLDLRFGFAPYIANYNQLNSWLILNLRTNTDFEKVSVIPTLRFYFNSYLWEFAQDLDGVTYLNFMVRL